MTNNDILRRIRYTFNYSDSQMITIFSLADMTVTRADVSSWLKKEEDEGFKEIDDHTLASFLNGFITEKRGKKDGPTPQAEQTLNFNIILNKLRIALNLRAEDIISLLKSMDLDFSKSEISAFFRKPDHKHYRQCKAQVMRNFLMAVQQKYRKSPQSKPAKPQSRPKTQTASNENRGEKVSARPNASKPYVNPNATKRSGRKTLKLKPEDIWKNQD